MKNLNLLILLLPTLIFGQIRVVQEIVETGPFSVGDVITYRISAVDETANGVDLSLFMVDINYNDAKVIPQSQTVDWSTFLSSQSKSVSQWNDYRYDPSTGVDLNDLDEQYNQGIGYSYLPEESYALMRYVIQSTLDIEGILFERKFVIKDLTDTAFTDFTEVFTLNWVKADERGTNIAQDVYGDPRVLDLNISYAPPVGLVTFKLETPNLTNITDYKIQIQTLEQYQLMISGTPPNNAEFITGNLDSTGEFSTSAMRQGVEYVADVYVKSEYSTIENKPIYPQWLDDVVTVSDVMLAFKQAIGTNPDGSGNVLTYNIQKTLSNVVRLSPTDPVNFDDSYALLAHITGILDNSASSQTATKFYPITSFNNGAFNFSSPFSTYSDVMSTQEEYIAAKAFVVNTSDPVTIRLAHALMGDVDLSHSTTPDAEKTSSLIAKGRQVAKVETADIDVVSQLVNGQVELSIGLTKTDLSGIQFNLRYDGDILEFKEIVFDTGNTITNFTKSLSNKIILGSIDPNGVQTVKTGKPFKVIFKPKQVITNTAGLISFDVTDAVTKQGNKVTLNIK